MCVVGVCEGKCGSVWDVWCPGGLCLGGGGDVKVPR